MRRLISSRIFAAIFFIFISFFAGTSRAVSPDQINAALDKAVKHLYDIQKDGIWELDPNPAPTDRMGLKGMHHGGLTALATYALLAAGEKPHDPKLAKAFDFLKKLNTESVYVLGVRIQIWPYLGDTMEARGLMTRDTDLILKQVKLKGNARGLFYYPGTHPDQYDHSISQFGVLGLWTAVQNNKEVALASWDMMDKAWRAHQQADGGWPYVVGNNGEEGSTTLSMTCAGVATLFITHDYVHAAKDRGCNGNGKDDNIERGLKYIADNFEKMHQGGRDGAVMYYTLYGLERIGVAAGYKEFGKTNWFTAGSEFLIKNQHPDGSWGNGQGDIFANNVANVPDTGFAMLFLAHGRAPAVINKLSYSDPQAAKASWNQRPRDIANLVRWTGHQLESPLNWHIVSLTLPIADLHDAPILYLAGSKAVNFNADDIAKLRQFVEEGGMLLANADCGSAEFTKSIEKLGSQMFHDYEFRELPANHPIFINQQFPSKKFKSQMRLRGQSNGIRELIVLIPDGDLSRTWQVPFQGTFEPYALGADIIEYATDRQGLQGRIESPVIEPDAKVATTGTIKLARLEYAGNWNPEPAGWKRMSGLLHNSYKLALEVETVKVGEGKLAGYKLAHMTGTAAFTLPEAQQQELKTFMNNGGTLIVDAAGGSETFGESFEKVLSRITDMKPEDRVGSPLPPEASLFNIAGAKIEKFHYRVFARSILAGSTNTPRLVAISQKGRPALYYSREDISAGLVGQEVDGIVGYTPETATQIMRNIVLSVLPPRPTPPATAPAAKK